MKDKIWILLMILCLLIIGVVTGITFSLDHTIYQFFVSFHNPLLLEIASFFSSFSSVAVLFVISFILIFFLRNNKDRLFLVITLLSSAAFILLTKNFFARPRPELGSMLTDYSFPSGHAFISVAFYGFLLYLLQKSKPNKYIKNFFTIFLIFLIVAIPLSRLVLGVHYITDVIAGAILGILLLFLIVYLYNKVELPLKKEKPLLQTFHYAIDGIFSTIKRERNMVIHVLVMILVVGAGIFYEISMEEWLICITLFGMVLALELVNTAVENVVDLVTEEKRAKAKLAKDAAAGAVLIMAFFAACVGILIFLPKII